MSLCPRNRSEASPPWAAQTGVAVGVCLPFWVPMSRCLSSSCRCCVALSCPCAGHGFSRLVPAVLSGSLWLYFIIAQTQTHWSCLKELLSGRGCPLRPAHAQTVPPHTHPSSCPPAQRAQQSHGPDADAPLSGGMSCAPLSMPDQEQAAPASSRWASRSCTPRGACELRYLLGQGSPNSEEPPNPLRALQCRGSGGPGPGALPPPQPQGRGPGQLWTSQGWRSWIKHMPTRHHL